MASSPTNPRNNRTLQKQPPQQKPPASVKVEASETISLPYPPPRMLKDYDDAVPGLAKQIMNMALEQNKHRQSQEEKALTFSHKETTRSQIYAFILGLAGLSVSAFIGHHSPLPGGLMGTGTILSLVLTLVIRRKKDSTKNQNNPSL